MDRQIDGLISVILSVYNEPLEWVKLSVDSILNQTYPKLELIIIIDDPNNKPVIDFLKETKKRNQNIIFLQNKKNLGLVESLNKGLTYAQGEYVARMDADDISDINRFLKQLEFLNERNVDLCGTNYVCFSDDNTIIYHSRLCINQKGIIRNLRLGSGGMAHPTWLGRRSVFTELNGYRNIDACEDLDFLTRAILKGFKVGNRKEELLKYRNNDFSISHKKETKQLTTAYLISKAFRNSKILDINDYEKIINKKSLNKIEIILYRIIIKIVLRISFELDKIDSGNIYG